MLSPKTVKHRKQQRRYDKSGVATRGHYLAFGDYGLMAKDLGSLSARQIEATRIAMTRYIKRGGKIWIRVFPDVPYTKKPAETRMGNGKGNMEYWYAKVKPGLILFEMSGVNVEVASRAMELAASKLPFASKFVTRKE